MNKLCNKINWNMKLPWQSEDYMALCFLVVKIQPQRNTNYVIRNMLYGLFLSLYVSNCYSDWMWVSIMGSVFILISDFAEIQPISNLKKRTNQLEGRAMAQAVSRRPLTAEARVRSRVGPCGIYGGQSGTGTGFFPSTSVFPCQFHSTEKTNHLHYRVVQ
jgi:hypothetical protein